MSTLLIRSLTGTTLSFYFCAALFIWPVWVFSLSTGLFSCVALYEFYTMMKKKGVVVYRVFGITIGAIIPFVVHFQLGSTQSGEVLFLVLACFGLFLIQFPRKDNPRAIEAVSITLYGMMYVSWFLSFLIRMRFLEGGAILVAYLVIVTKGGDIAAYLLGTLFGRRSLIPHISPKKSVEGLWGGVAASAVLSVLFYDILPFRSSRLELALMGSLWGLLGQCGDLAESLIKRSCGVKDSGRFLPGLGGVLDLLDSILFTTPLFYFYIKLQ